ncbi:unnamed protein product [Clavelina lepadiformis]|uniref:Uncharacterized protein n=1 Tax=Clavelina lepadiformis TaxID=159417 RepID=A0ABP0GCX7_CLALP
MTENLENYDLYSTYLSENLVPELVSKVCRNQELRQCTSDIIFRLKLVQVLGKYLVGKGKRAIVACLQKSERLGSSDRTSEHESEKQF